MKFQPIKTVRRAFAAVSAATSAMLTPVSTGTSWWAVVRESFTGAWQRNVEVSAANVLSYWAVYACIRQIAGDIAKMRLKLVEEAADGVWREIKQGSPFLPLLRKPNRYQTRVQFFFYWYSSLLIHGNTYALKVRDNRNVVIALYILDPTRVTVLVGDDGSIFYSLRRDDLSGVGNGQSVDTVVPASEILHDRLVCLHHPLVGVSPIFASGVAATQGLAIQNNSANFFQNGSMPGGIIKVPGSISPEKAGEMKLKWDTNYGGENRGKVAVLADKMEYQPLTMSAHDAQLIEQLKMTAEMVCSTFGVPAYKVGVAVAPQGSVAERDQAYYSDCLQPIMEGTEAVFDEGLGLSDANGRPPFSLGVEFELEDLIRMDPGAQIEHGSTAIKGAIKTPNEVRRSLGLAAKPGGDALYLQQQNFSLEALAKRDAQDDPFGSAKPAPAPTPDPAAEDDDAATAVDSEAIAAEAGKAAAEAVTRALAPMGERLAAVETMMQAAQAPTLIADELAGLDAGEFTRALEIEFPDG